MSATLEFPGELVTEALLNFIDLPGVGRLALITLDNGQDHTKPNTFGPAGLASLNTALDAVESDAAAGTIVGVGVTGKPFIFAVGADLTGVPSITDRASALAVAELGHRTFRRFGTLPVPSFAFVNGAALGGGLELALHCTYRTISSGAAAIALPECFLGLLPGWGGATLLPRLIGAEKAIGVILTNALNQNRTLRGAKAFELGIADVMFDPADFLECSLLWAGRVLNGATEVSRVPVDTGDHWTAAVAKGRAFLEAKLHGAAPAPMRALDVVSLARTASLEDCFTLENEALADLIRSDELRAGLYAFDLVQRRAKRPVGAPPHGLARPVTKVGIVGAGLMASQLALLFAERLEVPVVLTDVSDERIAGGLAWVHDQLDAKLRAGRASQDRVNRVKGLVTGLGRHGRVRRRELRHRGRVRADGRQEGRAGRPRAARRLGVRHRDEHVLALDHGDGGRPRPPRAGRRDSTSSTPSPSCPCSRSSAPAAPTTRRSRRRSRWAASCKKSCVAVSDRPAFVVNRLLTRFLGEVTAAVDAGTPPAIADRALDSLGLPMSPFTLLALVGPPVALHVSETLHAAFPDRFTVSENLRRLVAAGKPAVFLADGRGGQQLDPEVADLFVLGDSPRTAEEVRDACLAALAEEVRIMLDEGVVAEAQDIDLCMILGAGWPFHLGGITPYLDRSGVAEKVTGKRFLDPGVADLGCA